VLLESCFDQSCQAAASLFALRAGGEIEAAGHLARQEIKKTLPPTPDVGSRGRDGKHVSNGGFSCAITQALPIG